MDVPVLRKIIERDGVLMERCLPDKGMLQVTEGDEVRPFDHLGHCNVSHRKLVLPENFKPSVLKANENRIFAYFGSVLGKSNGHKVTAPYNGYLVKTEQKTYRFEEEPKRHDLLAGVWGVVEKVVSQNSVLIKTQMRDINMVAATPNNFVGELVVFPSQKDFFQKYFVSAVTSKPGGKIIYVGDYVDFEMIKRAADVGVGAIVAGSGKREILTYAKRLGLHLGLISGFGEIMIRDEIFKQLNKTSERLVFFHGDAGLLRIPVTKEDISASSTSSKGTKVIKKVRKGMDVATFQGAYFGYVGKVDSLKESSILVRFQGVAELVEVFLPNFFILE